MKAGSFDPRGWNIFLGLCLTSSCGERTVGVDTTSAGTTKSDGTTESGGATEGGESDSATTVDTGEPECITDADCPAAKPFCYYEHCTRCGCDCLNVPYVCCVVDYDCLGEQLCEAGCCSTPPFLGSCAFPDPILLLDIPMVGALNLSFADVDADGADELVVATATELKVYENGSDVPLSSPHGFVSDIVDAMVAAPFDAMPGDDVVILVDDELRRYASDGFGNFAASSVSPSPWVGSLGLVAGEFDEQAPADLLIWAQTGSGMLLGSGGEIPLEDDTIESATAGSLGVVLQREEVLSFYTLAGTFIGSPSMRGVSPHALTSIEDLGGSFILSASSMPIVRSSDFWTIIEQWDPATAQLVSKWAVLDSPVKAMRAASFDGMGADVALLVGNAVEIMYSPSPNGCIAFQFFFHADASDAAVDLAVGDHDGDGDDELAIRFLHGGVAILDPS